MKVKLLKAYEGGKKGDIIDVEDKIVAGLKVRGIAAKALDSEVKEQAKKEKEEKEPAKEKKADAGPNAKK